ncbi:hypothetical protein KCU95_g6772, partial [Aureobasidium melanogenum]
MLQLPPIGSHPVLIARKLLLLGNYLQGVVLPSDQASQKHEPWYHNIMFRVMDAAIKVTKNEDLVSSVEGIECIMLEATYQNYAGNLHQAWMAVRRATTIAQVLGLHRGNSSPNLKFLETMKRPLFDSEQTCLQIVRMECYLGLILGLPRSSLEAPPHKPEDLGTCEHLQYSHLIVADRILKRSTPPSLLEIQELDSLLERAAANISPQWWLVPDLSTSNRTGNEIFRDINRLNDQFAHFHLLIRVHLPHLMQRTCDRTYDYSKMTALNASRETLIRYVAFRDRNAAAFYCRGTDFISFGKIDFGVEGSAVMVSQEADLLDVDVYGVTVDGEVADGEWDMQGIDLALFEDLFGGSEPNLCLSKPVQPARAKRTRRARQPSTIRSTTPDSSKVVESSLCELVNERGHSRYVENVMWVGVGQELSAFSGQDEPDLDIDPPSDTSPASILGEGLIFGQSVVNLSDKHPDPSRIIWLWSTYLENVNILVRILHIPTVQPLILNMASDPTRPKTKEALLFSIYLAAICSVPQCDYAEAERIMGQPIGESIHLYTGLAQQALINARFLQTPNFLTLQALALFLVAQRARLDPQTMWQLTGVAIRSAQQLGYHREKALTSPSVSVFQAELRRRLWWELTLLESFAAKQCGVMSIISFRSLWDTNRPLNINDSALHPEMQDVPHGVPGITETSFCSARFEVGELTIRYTSPDRTLQDPRDVDVAIEELQQRLENKLLKHCDPSIPWHKLLRLFCRGALARIKLTVRRHQMFASSGLSLDQRDSTFLLCLHLVEALNSFTRDKALQKYLWQANAFFAIDAFMFLLGEIAYRTIEQPLPVPLGTVWAEIEKAFDSQPRLLYDESNAIYSAVRNLSLKAWEKTCGQNAEQAVPQFIRILRSRLATANTSGEVTHTAALNTSTGDVAETNTFDGNEFNFDLDSLDPNWSKIAIPDDQEFWEYWQQFAADETGLSIS